MLNFYKYMYAILLIFTDTGPDTIEDPEFAHLLPVLLSVIIGVGFILIIIVVLYIKR
jgi:hypothetical protein